MHLREKTLYRMLYESAGRSEEILGLNIEGLDFAGRRCQVKAKGVRTKGRGCGPVFLTHRRGPGKVVNSRDVCPDTGLARLSYGQARALLDEHTAIGGPGRGWDLHEFRHSALAHLGQAGASLLMLMAKSRHKKPENLRRYFKPSPEAMAELTSLLAPGDSGR
jgi:site-specific recombinase XerD